MGRRSAGGEETRVGWGRSSGGGELGRCKEMGEEMEEVGEESVRWVNVA